MEKFSYGKLSDGREVTAFRITNKNGCSLMMIDFGATVVSLTMPNKDGKMTDVVIGYDTGKEYGDNEGFLGACIGRFGNRIGKGKFELNGTVYDIEKSEGNNVLHGGILGYHKRFFEGHEEDGKLVFTRLSPDGEAGFPGNLQVRVEVSLSDDNVLEFHYTATTDKDTVVNLTNHAYYNLAGHGDILGHELKIYASNYTPIDAESIPTGEIAPVVGTPLDFTKAKPIGQDIGADMEQMKIVGGFDHNYVLDSKEPFHKAAELYCPETGIQMLVETKEAGMQFYSGNWISAKVGKGGAPMDIRYGLCLETQNFPDAVNKPNFPSAVLRVGETYDTRTTYSFTVR